MLGTVVHETIIIRLQAVRAEPRTGKESRDVGDAVEMPDFLPVVVIKKDFFRSLAWCKLAFEKASPLRALMT
jgi:hypothetical protein